MWHRESHMTYDDSTPRNPVATSIQATIAHHGALRVLAAALLALAHPKPLRPPPTDVRDLDDHLRQDVGLPPKAATLRSPPVHIFLP